MIFSIIIWLMFLTALTLWCGTVYICLIGKKGTRQREVWRAVWRNRKLRRSKVYYLDRELDRGVYSPWNYLRLGIIVRKGSDTDTAYGAGIFAQGDCALNEDGELEMQLTCWTDNPCKKLRTLH